LALVNDVPSLIEFWKDNQSTFIHNNKLFDVYEGQLLPYILEDLKRQLSEKSYETIQHRVPPINILKRIIDKLSKIYTKPPIRTVINGKKKDKDALGELLRVSEFDAQMSDANEFFNLFKNTFVEPYLHNGVPKIRALPSDRFFAYSVDAADPTNPTHIVKIMGVDPKDKSKVIFHAYTDEEFLIFDSKGVVRRELMAIYGRDDGRNIYGKIPGVYINRSKYNIIPKPDTDILPMTKLIPILLSDCNFAVMFQSFSIIYGIDVNDENLKMAPNAFWRFKSEPGTETKPEIGVLKPEVDTDKVINLISSELAMWLDSKNIKPGTVGDMTIQNAASGVAKIIDESDTSEDRRKQTTYFSAGEIQLLQLIINHMFPVWKTDKSFSFEGNFSGQDVRLSSIFPEQRPIIDPKQVVDTEVAKLDAGLTTKKLAIKNINPDMTDEDINNLITEIDAEKQKVIVQPPVPPVDPEKVSA
jgi:hypothetical protein